MQNLKTQYLGLELKNPIIVGSSGLTDNIQDIKKIEKAGAGAVVLKSIFEEQIKKEINSLQKGTHPEEKAYLSGYIEEHDLEEYSGLINNAKQKTDLPIIASINCNTATEWTHFIEKIDRAGADAIELNIFIMPLDKNKTSSQIEARIFEIVKKATSHTDKPVSLKISYHFSSLSNVIYKLSQYDISGLVLFNRFYTPDIDIENLEMCSGNTLSKPFQIFQSLRWIGMLSNRIECDFAASTGVHDGEGAVKCLLAGANVVQVVSTLYQNGINYIENILEDLKIWMHKKNYTYISDFQGKLNQSHIDDPELYERSQFLKYFAEEDIE